MSATGLTRRGRGRGGALRWLTLACAGTMVVTGCGGAAQDGGRSGGTIRVSYTAFPDRLDPALAGSQSALQTLRTVYTPLLSYAHAPGADGAKIVPGLAETLPEVSLDGRTYLLKLREKLRYSDGSPVHASDFEHAIRRVLRLRSAGARYFTQIVGADAYRRSDDADADIAGIATSDRTNDLTITLEQPNPRFPEVLALEYGALVPGDTPFSDQTRTPPPGVGPYRLAKRARGPGLRARPAARLRSRRPAGRQARPARRLAGGRDGGGGRLRRRAAGRGDGRHPADPAHRRGDAAVRPAHAVGRPSRIASTRRTAPSGIRCTPSTSRSCA